VLLGAMSLFSNDLAIDLGTANTCVFARGQGIVLNEPSIVAVNKITNRIEAVGNEAKEMVGRTPGSIVAIRPLREGVIADFDAAERMLGHFIRKANGHRRFLRPRVIIGVPSQITQVERRAVKDSAHRAKASEVHLIDEGMAAAVGAGLPISEACGNMIVDIGGGTTDIAVVSLAGVVYSRSVRIAGNAMDDAITHYVKREHDLLIGERTAERVKIELGSAVALESPKEMEVKGRHVLEGKPATIRLTDSEVREALAEPVRQIVIAVRNALECIPPELSADVCDRGIVLSGGGALLQRLDERLRRETGLPVQVAEDPLSAVVLGAGKMLSDIGLLRKISMES
jgi:rod shape-determining protein MreB and related proteins